MRICNVFRVTTLIRQILNEIKEVKMEHTRRDFLKMGVITIGGLAIPLSAFEFLTPKAAANIVQTTNIRWVFLVDILKCIG